MFGAISVSGILAILFSGAGGALLLAALKWGPAKYQQWRERRAAKRTASFAGFEKRLKVLEEARQAQEEFNRKADDTMNKVITFIEGSKDPFTGRTSGGLLKFMRQIEHKLGLDDDD